MDATMDQTKRLVDGNVAFRRSMDPSLLRNLAKGQHPFVAILACSDSRVSPEKLFNLGLGDAFVVRVVGNSVADPGAMGSLEYAVEHLKVKSIVVLGHTGCGAVKAGMERKGDEPSGLRPILSDIERAGYRLPTDQQTNQDLVSENNVRMQVKSIAQNSSIIGTAANKGEVSVKGAMYDLSTGAVKFV